MSITATGFLSLPLTRLAQLVASSESFRQQVEAVDEAEALKSIHIGLADIDNPDEPPNRAVIRYLDSSELDQVATTVASGQGLLALLFEFPTPLESVDGDTVNNSSDEYIAFTNLIGAIISEMKVSSQNANTGNGYLSVQNWLIEGLGWAADDENNALSFMQAPWVITFEQRL